MEKYLSKVVLNHQKDWDKYLHLFLMANGSSVHETTGKTPASVLFSQIRLPCDLKFGLKPDKHVAGKGYASELRRKMNSIHEKVRANIQVNSDRMKYRYDINAKDTTY